MIYKTAKPAEVQGGLRVVFRSLVTAWILYRLQRAQDAWRVACMTQ
jgi:hypothetical protein